MPTFEATIWTSVWGERAVPASVLGERRFIRARSSMEASQEASARWPHAVQITIKPTEGRVRTILIHLNVEVPEGDERSVDEIVRAVDGVLEVGSDDPSVSDLKITIPLAEEVQV